MLATKKGQVACPATYPFLMRQQSEALSAPCTSMLIARLEALSEAFQGICNQRNGFITYN